MGCRGAAFLCLGPQVLEARHPWTLEKGGPWSPEAQAALWPPQCGSLLFSQAAWGCCPRGPGPAMAFHTGPYPASFPLGSATCPVSLLLTLSTLYLLDEDLEGSQAEAPLPAASGEASEKAPPSGPGLSLCVREQQPLSSLSSVLLYRTAPEDLRLVFYDEVCVRACGWERNGAEMVCSVGNGSRKARNCGNVELATDRSRVQGTGGSLGLDSSK